MDTATETNGIMKSGNRGAKSGKPEPVLPLFVQMNVRWEGTDTAWREASRWVRFEEDVEECGKRWSKPHVPATPLSSFLQLKEGFANGIVALDVPGNNIQEVIDEVARAHLSDSEDFRSGKKPAAIFGQSESEAPKLLTDSQFRSLKSIVNQATKLRVTLKLINKVSNVVAGSGGNSESGSIASGGVGGVGSSAVGAGIKVFRKISASHHNRHTSYSPQHAAVASLSTDGAAHQSIKMTTSHGLLKKEVDKFQEEASSNSLEGMQTLKSPDNMKLSTTTSNNPFARKVPKGAESCLILAATVDFVEAPLVVWVRLKEAIVQEQECEIGADAHTKFLGFVLRPLDDTTMATEIGKVMGTLMSDQIFAGVAYSAGSKEEILEEMETYTREMTVLAPSAWDPAIRLEPPKTLPSVSKRLESLSRQSSSQDRYSRQLSGISASKVAGATDLPDSNGLGNGGSSPPPPPPDDNDVEAAAAAVQQPPAEEEEEEDMTLKATGKPFGGLIADIKRKLPWFKSDFTDAFAAQTLASIIYIYLATVTKAITFGGFLGDITDGVQGVLEAFLGHALAGGFFCLLGGQPLTVLGCTGPVLIFEKILVDSCHNFGLDYMTFRLWIGLWSVLFCLIIVATDASAFVRYFTRFTEESFAALIGIIFIIESLKKLFKMSKTYKVHEDFDLEHLAFEDETCHCLPPDDLSLAASKFETMRVNFTDEFSIVNARSQVNGSMVSADTIPWNWLELHECEQYGGHLSGLWCNYVPDVFFFSVLLFFGTFTLATFLKQFKFTAFLPSKVRALISDYAVIIAILAFAMLDNTFHLQTPKLIVPTVFKPTRSDLRGWVVPFTHETFAWHTYLLASVPSLLLTILLFMDQQITSVIVNRKEHKLRKGCGYHLDMLIVGLMMGVCSVLGLPWCVAATVLCLGHVDSLKMETETSAPGETPQFLGVREQRVTGVMVFVLTGLSVKLAPILKFIPMPVLYGVLMYMGVSSLKGMQLIDRVAIIFMPPKYQPDHIYLRHVPLRKVHLFTAIQVLSLALLWILKSTKASLIFPLMVLALVGFRKLMDYTPRVFTQNDLFWLDSLMPDTNRNKAAKNRKSNDKKSKNNKKGGGRFGGCCGRRKKTRDEEKDHETSSKPMIEPTAIN